MQNFVLSGHPPKPALEVRMLPRFRYISQRSMQLDCEDLPNSSTVSSIYFHEEKPSQPKPKGLGMVSLLLAFPPNAAETLFGKTWSVNVTWTSTERSVDAN